MAHRSPANMASAFQYTWHLKVSLVSLTVPVLDTIRQRFVNFINSCLSSPNELVTYIIRHSILDLQMHSRIVRNLYKCCEHFHCDADSLLSHRLNTSDCLENFSRRTSLTDRTSAGAIAELVFVRQGLFQIGNLSDDDINNFLSSFCI
jgi:hypothetical protein